MVNINKSEIYSKLLNEKKTIINFKVDQMISWSLNSF